RGRVRQAPRRRAPFLYYPTDGKRPALRDRGLVTGNTVARLDLLDLEEIELDGSLAAEEGDEHRDFVSFGMNLADLADEFGEGAINHLDALADGKIDLRLGLSGRLLALLGWGLQDVAQLV